MLQDNSSHMVNPEAVAMKIHAVNGGAVGAA